MTNLERLEKDIIEKIPRLMELTEGCIVDIYKLSKVRLTHPIVTNEGGRICTPYHVYTEFQVIGHEILLSDVLDWLREIYRAGILIDGKGYFWDLDSESPTVERNGWHWDLIKPCLRDQSEELIDYLASLIEDHTTKYEMLLESKAEDSIQIDGWVSIDESMIPEGKTDYYLKKGLIRLRK